MQPPGRVRSLAVELEDGRAWGAYGSGELLHGRVQLELRGALRLRALEVYARGRAATHWLESYSVGLNTIYRDYTAYQTFLYRRCQLIPGKAGVWGWFSAPARWVGTPLGCRHPLRVNLCPDGCLPTQAGLSLLDTLFSPLPRVSVLLVSWRLPANSGLVSTKELWLLFCLHREVQIEVSVRKCGKST